MMKKSLALAQNLTRMVTKPWMGGLVHRTPKWPLASISVKPSMLTRTITVSKMEAVVRIALLKSATRSLTVGRTPCLNQLAQMGNTMTRKITMRKWARALSKRVKQPSISKMARTWWHAMIYSHLVPMLTPKKSKRLNRVAREAMTRQEGWSWMYTAQSTM